MKTDIWWSVYAISKNSAAAYSCCQKSTTVFAVTGTYHCKQPYVDAKTLTFFPNTWNMLLYYRKCQPSAKYLEQQTLLLAEVQHCHQSLPMLAGNFVQPESTFRKPHGRRQNVGNLNKLKAGGFGTLVNSNHAAKCKCKLYLTLFNVKMLKTIK